jgi:hypothetical protein
MEHLSTFINKTGIIIYLKFEKINSYDYNNHECFLYFSNVTNFNPDSIVKSKTDYFCVNNIKCLKAIPIAFIESNEKELCLKIAREIRENNNSKNNYIEPNFMNIQNIYKIINDNKLNIIRTNFLLNNNNDLMYNNIILIQNIMENRIIKFTNDNYKNDSDDDRPNKKRKMNHNEDSDSEYEPDSNEDSDSEYDPDDHFEPDSNDNEDNNFEPDSNDNYDNDENQEALYNIEEQSEYETTDDEIIITEIILIDD